MMATWTELVSRGEVPTCYNRSHWSWQARKERIMVEAAGSPSW